MVSGHSNSENKQANKQKSNPTENVGKEWINLVLSLFFNWNFSDFVQWEHIGFLNEIISCSLCLALTFVQLLVCLFECCDVKNKPIPSGKRGKSDSWLCQDRLV